MSARFLAYFVVAFLATLLMLAGAGYAISSLSVRAPREVYRTAFFEFELAPGWTCMRDRTEVICSSDRASKERLVIITMKERNERDTIDEFQRYLEQPKRRLAQSGELPGRGELSEVRHVRRRRLGEREWVEALHLGSEVEGFLTYYLATHTSLVAILVTMSVREEKAANHFDELASMMSTLHVYQQ